MPYLPTSQSWLHHSALLLQAQPTSTRITTKYTLTSTSTSTGKPRKSNNPTNPAPPPTTTDPPQQQPQPTKGTLTLKTYDPTSGICLKYRTDKAAEVGRLVASLGRLGRYMSGMDVKEEEGGEEEVGGGVVGEGTSTPVLEMGAAVAGLGKGTGTGKGEGKGGAGVGAGAGGEKGKGAGGAGSGGKKKKGKR